MAFARTRVMLACACAGAVALAGCRQKPGPRAASPAAHAGDAAPAAVAPADAGAAPNPFVLGDAALDRYARFQQAFLARLQALEKGWASRQVPDTADPAQVAKAHRSLADAARTAARDDVGLDAAEEQRLTPMIDAVAADRRLFQQAGGDEALRELGDLDSHLAQLPPDQRARAESEYRESKQILLDLKTARRARGRYGDAAVDRILAHGDLVSTQERIDRMLPSPG